MKYATLITNNSQVSFVGLHPCNFSSFYGSLVFSKLVLYDDAIFLKLARWVPIVRLQDSIELLAYVSRKFILFLNIALQNGLWL